MKTIAQYKEDIAALMKKIEDIDSQCQLEARDYTQEERDLKNEIMDTIQEYTENIETIERQNRIKAAIDSVSEPQTRVQPGNQGDRPRIEVNERETFPTFGDQMVAVMNAGRPGGSVDPRLLNAATGLGETVPSDGGFLVQQDFTNELLQEVFDTGVLASRCRRIPISGSANSIKINGVDETSRASTRYGGVVGYWADEADEKTASKPKFRKIELSLKKLVGLCYATDELLLDAAALAAFIRQAFAGEFGFKVDDAIVNGTGAGQPLGILNAGCLVSVAKESGQSATTIVSENIIKMYARRFASMTNNYVWYYNQDIEPQLLTMSLAVGTGGAPIYMPPGGLSASPYGTLLGLPAIAIEQCATLGTQGDIILADLADGYILAEKGGIQADMSIHVRFIYDESVFRFVLRLDGQPQRASALTPYKGSNTQSHFIVLDTRS